MTTPTPHHDTAADESRLVNLARAGDHEAFGILVERHQRRLWMVCRQYVGPDEADAATQETFLKAFQGLAVFDGRAAFSTWLTRIGINNCLDQLRRRRREGLRIEEPDDDERPGVLAEVADDRSGPEERTMQRDAVARLATCERSLPERQREIFRLRFYAELELGDIAEALGVHVGTVKTQLHRAVHRLRRELGDHR